MAGFVDLHCHWVSSIDDGVKTKEDGIALLQGLKRLGFDDVVATPHMRPGMFDNDAVSLRAAFAAMAPALEATPGLPRVSLGSEHFLDDVVFERLRRGEGLPYAGGGAILVELSPEAFPRYLPNRFFDLRRAGYQVVLAHPERYQPVWKDDACLDALLDAGAHLLLDVCAIVGKYGRASQKAAEKLLEDDAYEAACSDAHRPSDVEVVGEALRRLEVLVGEAETYRLLGDGPRALLAQAPLATRASTANAAP